MANNTINFKALSEPFPAEDIEWFISATTKDKSKGLAVPFITNRAVQDRLDAVCGPENWKNEYEALKETDVIDRDGTITGKKYSYLCGISVWSEARAEWITKWDGAEDTDVEALKGGLSSAMKRAAVQFGIGRYLYKLDNVWVEIEQKGNSYIISPTQKIVLPAWALPGGSGNPGPDDSRKPMVALVGQQQNNYNYPPQQAQGSTQGSTQGNAPQQTQRRGNLSVKQIDRALKKGYAAGQSQEDIQFWIEKKYGVKDLAELNRAQYDELCAALDKAAMQK